ncbi:MAG: helix-turn-helix transcriptional regulator [Lachnospiraceae bacterium]|nr:helix-turn-helix transcriptional regulator [Lachnospiraceae bacterium]MBQ4069655.1 helix-turn-helix transcriptional regulator [Lachnospiraceae bacterium]
MIDILKRINQLRVERGWSEYQLSVKADITQSTISSWYRKNMLPSIPSIQKICNAFDITMSQFFIEDSDMTTTITPQQKRLLAYSAKLEPEQMDALLKFLDIL